MVKPKRTRATKPINKTNTKRRKSIIHFEGIQLEGGILSPAQLSKIAQFAADGQNETDYGVPKGLTLRDEIGRYWRMATAQWQSFQKHQKTENFIPELLRSVFGFTEISVPMIPDAAVKSNDRAYPLTAGLRFGRLPLVLSPPTIGLDKSDVLFGEEGRKRTAFGLIQEYLNSAEDALWGLASDGNTLRIARDNASLTRPAWIEADFARIFEEELYADFATLWLILHATRFGEKNQLPEECIIEQWRKKGQSDGARASEKLRIGVEHAVKILGDGFLKSSKNQNLKDSIRKNELNAHDYYQELLRLVYRFIFLLTVEERDRLHPKSTPKRIREIYLKGYSLGRIRDRSIRRTAYDHYGDLWEVQKIVFTGLTKGETRLGIPALGGLFDLTQTPNLIISQLENRYLLTAIQHLAWLHDDEEGLVKVNWRDMGPEELGSVYESLLELVPQFTDSGLGFAFAGETESKGNQRKTSGSYYTPDSLVQSLLDTALDPVIEATIQNNPSNPDRALLKLKIIDPACGSGHFLLGAARRLAAHIARLRSDGTPTTEQFEKALRDVITKCIYGVDRNPMALELARTALWLEAVSPDFALGFLDHHLICGDALLGLMDLSVVKDGIPQEAFKKLEGDDQDVVKQLSTRNREALKSIEKEKELAQLGVRNFESFEPRILTEYAAVEEMSDSTIDEVEQKKTAFRKLQTKAFSIEEQPIGLAADLFVTAFIAAKKSETENLVPTTFDVVAVLDGQKIDPKKIEFARNLARKYRVLHWRLKFAKVFQDGGFDVVLGNPPWERMRFQIEEFFSNRDSEIVRAQNMAEREKLINKLKSSETGTPAFQVYQEFESAKHYTEASAVFMHQAFRYPLTGVGDVNTYPLFAETFLALKSDNGRSGIIVPSGIASDDNTKAFFGNVSQGNLVSLIDFENREKIFPAVDSRQKFCLLTLGSTKIARFSFFLTNSSQIGDSRRQFALTPDEVILLNPNTKTCPIFRSEKDAELTKKIYSRVPVLWDETREDGNPWGISFLRMFDMSTDSGLFATSKNKMDLKDPVPLYEGKMVHQFNDKFATYASDSAEGTRDVTDEEKSDPNFRITPRYWVERAEVEERLASKDWKHPWLLGWRDICRATDERTVIASLLPRVGVANTLPQYFTGRQDQTKTLVTIAILNSLVFDYCARQKVAGTHLTYGYIKQLPIPSPTQLDNVTITILSDKIFPFYPELLGKGKNIKYSQKHSLLRAEVDAYIAALYGLTREDLCYILDPADIMGEDYPSETFRVLKNKEMKLYGEYRTRRLVIEAWDRLEKSGELPDPVKPWRQM